MINPYNFVKALKNNKINFITGVPDSLLKNLTNCISDKFKKNHIISTNEGSAVSLAIGHYLAKKQLPLEPKSRGNKKPSSSRNF